MAHQLVIPVRWSDLDALNHVNNLAFLDFIQEARIQAFDAMGVRLEGVREGPVVVNVNCNYRREIRYPTTVRVDTRLEVASSRKLLMHHRIVNNDDPEILYADACITVVWVNYAEGGATRLPAAVIDQTDTPGDAGS